MLLRPQGEPQGLAVWIDGRGKRALVDDRGQPSAGVQKLLDPQIALIWPAVLAGQVAAVTVLTGLMPRRAPRSGGRAHVA